MSKEVTVIREHHAGPSSQSYSFDQLHRMAVTFAKSGLYGIKDENQAFALMLEAQAQNKHPALIVRDYDMIGNRLSKKSGAMLRDFQNSGGRVRWQELTDARACATFSHPLSPEPVTIDWDMDRAKKAGLAGKEGSMYTKYARSMLRSRCISEGIRSTAPEATEQMYTPEEIRAIEQETPAPVAMTAAIAQATDQIKAALPKEELDALIMSMDVKSEHELIMAFGKAYTRAKESNDEHAKKVLKDTYDDMKSAIESGQIV